MKLRDKLQKSVCKAFLLILTFFATVSYAATCPIDAATPSRIIEPQIKASEQAITNALTAMDRSVGHALDYQTYVLMGGLSTLTSQKAQTASSVGKAISDNTQLQTAAMQSVETNRKLKDVTVEYGPKSTGFQVCKVQAERQKSSKTAGVTKEAIAEMVAAEVTARPGGYDSSGEALATRLALHDKLYCTAGQAASGLCTREAPRAGKSLQASTMFVPADYDSAEYRDKSAFINNMLGLPDDPLTQEKAATVPGQAYSDLKRRKDAIMSTAAVSLKALQAETSVVSQNHKDTDETKVAAKSEAEQLAQADEMPSAEQITGTSTVPTLKDDPLSIQIKKDVSRYLGGGEEYKEWSKALVGMPERGVLQELLKVTSLKLYLQSRQYEQLSRMEAMLASNVAAETYRSGMEDNIERQRQVIMRKNVAQSIGN